MCGAPNPGRPSVPFQFPEQPEGTLRRQAVPEFLLGHACGWGAGQGLHQAVHVLPQPGGFTPLGHLVGKQGCCAPFLLEPADARIYAESQVQVTLVALPGHADHFQKQQVRSVGSGMSPGMGAQDIAEKGTRGAVQKQAGGKVAVLVPGVQQGQVWASGKNALCAGIEFPDVIRHGDPACEFSPKSAMGRGECGFLLHPQGGGGPLGKALETGRNRRVRRQNQVLILTAAMLLQSFRQGRAMGAFAGGAGCCARFCFGSAVNAAPAHGRGLPPLRP